MQGSRRARAPPIYPCLPVEGKGEGCPVWGRVRARVRVRVSQGCTRFAKGEGEGAREPHQPFFPTGHFSKDLWSGASNNAGLVSGGPPGSGCHRSIRSSPLHPENRCCDRVPVPCTVSSCSAALRDPNQPRATPRPRPPAHHYRPPPAPLNHAAETILQEGEKDRHAAAHRQGI